MFSIAIGLSKPNSIWSVLGGWLSFIGGKEKRLIFVGVTTIFGQPGSAVMTLCLIKS
jgi:hypothetical protein